MFKINPVFSLMVILLVVSVACSTTPSVSAPTLSANEVNTVVAQTLISMQLNGTQPATTQAAPMTETPTFTPSASPTITLTITPIFTFTPPVPLIRVEIATNCREGPGQAYNIVGALLVDETTEVIGQDPTGRYWYVRNPDPGDEFCWLWGEYATLMGNTLALPVFTPPPTATPAPGFNASYSGPDNCLTEWWVDIELENTGSLVFRSISLTVFDTVTKTTLALIKDEFVNDDGCSSSNAKNTLQTGSKLTVSSPRFSYDPDGHKIRATLTLCSATGVNGQCVTQVINFTP